MSTLPAIERYPSEYKTFLDSRTKARIHQLTQAPCVNHLPYFLTSAFTPDGSTVLFSSNRTGEFQLYETDFPEGEIRRLTDISGFRPFSPILSHDGLKVYFTYQDCIAVLNRSDLSITTLYQLADAQFGECSLSHNGKWLVTAFKSKDGFGVALASTDGGGEILVRFPRTVIHPQFHPLDDNWVEFAGDPAPRMHRIRRDGTQLECLYNHDNNEFVVHETFLGETGDLLFTVWPKSLKRMDWNTREITTISDFNAWHITPNKAGTKVLCDTNHPDIGLQMVDVASGTYKTICYPQSSNGGTQWKKSRYAVAEDWAEAAKQRDDNLSWMEMATDTVYGPQWSHPHPAFSYDEKFATYTSDVSGHAQVYVVEL